MNSSWWSGVDTNAKILISFQTLLIVGLAATNFFLFFIIETYNYGLYFSGTQMFGSPQPRNNPARNVVNYHIVDTPQ